MKELETLKKVFKRSLYFFHNNSSLNSVELELFSKYS